MRSVQESDIDLLVDLMSEFYGEAGYRLDRHLAGKAFQALIGDQRLGRVWLIEVDGAAAGYVVLTLRFAMEFGGLLGCIDDLYVRPDYRGRGLASDALESVRDFCSNEGVRAVTVEVGPENLAAQAVYRRIGMSEVLGRQLMQVALAKPSHVQ